ncbi:hypothetical protein FB451DRAFT_1169627 [Mycena latifolia]|nr:hypothetical protein FB451DRAFT_1169627 [Mycena latifolia]
MLQVRPPSAESLIICNHLPNLGVWLGLLSILSLGTVVLLAKALDFRSYLNARGLTTPQDELTDRHTSIAHVIEFRNWATSQYKVTDESDQFYNDNVTMLTVHNHQITKCHWASQAFTQEISLILQEYGLKEYHTSLKASRVDESNFIPFQGSDFKVLHKSSTQLLCVSVMGLDVSNLKYLAGLVPNNGWPLQEWDFPPSLHATYTRHEALFPYIKLRSDSIFLGHQIRYCMVEVHRSATGITFLIVHNGSRDHICGAHTNALNSVWDELQLEGPEGGDSGGGGREEAGFVDDPERGRTITTRMVNAAIIKDVRDTNSDVCHASYCKQAPSMFLLCAKKMQGLCFEHYKLLGPLAKNPLYTYFERMVSWKSEKKDPSLITLF